MNCHYNDSKLIKFMIIFLLPKSSSFPISELAITECYTSLWYILVNFKRCLQSSTKLKNLCVFVKYGNYFVLLVIIPVLYLRMFSFFYLFVCLLFLFFILLHVKKSKCVLFYIDVFPHNY